MDGNNGTVTIPVEDYNEMRDIKKLVDDGKEIVRVWDMDFNRRIHYYGYDDAIKNLEEINIKQIARIKELDENVSNANKTYQRQIEKNDELVKANERLNSIVKDTSDNSKYVHSLRHRLHFLFTGRIC